MQAGGSDQWGNITAGIELIRRVRGAQAFGITFPLLATSQRRKIRQERRQCGLAGRGAHQPLPVLSILDSHRRSRCGALPEALHVFNQ